jgi:hypothetical protein
MARRFSRTMYYSADCLVLVSPLPAHAKQEALRPLTVQALDWFMAMGRGQKETQRPVSSPLWSGGLLSRNWLVVDW